MAVEWVTADVARAQLVLELVPIVPRPVWGRDELGAGEMWNSNSVISWLLLTAGLDMSDIRPPRSGRAPGWDAGLEVAKRQRETARALPERGRARPEPSGYPSEGLSPEVDR